MKTNSLKTVAALLVVSGFQALAQEKPPQYEHLKPIEGFVGTWEGAFDPPGNVPPGIVRVNCKWMGNRTYLYVEGLFTPNGTDIVFNPVNIFVGFNGKTQATHAWQMKMSSQASTPATITDNKLVMKNGEDIDFAGKPLARTVIYELRSPDELVITSTDITKDGKALPDEPVIVMKRIE